ncbi:thymidine kinase [Candidatus Babeliales bacterium]|nr:thymidine kinase [Candidatus Babeliales bacterium]
MFTFVKKSFLYLFLMPSYMVALVPQVSEPIHRMQPLAIQHKPFERGSLSVICGSMCSGKSEELIRTAGRFILSGFHVLVFKPTIDTRTILQLELDPLTYISSRSGSWVECIAVQNCTDMKKYTEQTDAQVIAIDEVMFFTHEADELIQLINTLVAQGKKVMVAGLDLNFRGEPFGPMPQLLALADNVMKLTAICSVCGTDTYCITQRLVDGQPAHRNDPLIVVESSQKSITYEPRCRKCHTLREN